MLPERPDINVFTKLTDQLADIKDDLGKMEYQYEKMVATHIRTAMRNGAKTRELDYVKVLGITEADTAEMDDLKQKIFDRRKAITILYGKIEAWKSQKELYRTDSYHQVTGRIGLPREEEDSEV